MRRRFGELICKLADKDKKIVLLVGDIGYGIFNSGTIDTGKGDDLIVAEAGRAGIINFYIKPVLPA